MTGWLLANAEFRDQEGGAMASHRLGVALFGAGPSVARLANRTVEA